MLPLEITKVGIQPTCYEVTMYRRKLGYHRGNKRRSVSDEIGLFQSFSGLFRGLFQ